MKRVCLFLFLLLTTANAQHVFLFGDSMAEALAKSLEKNFSQTSHSYAYMFKRGTTIDYWIHNPELFVSLHTRKPDFVIISLSTNDLVAKKTNDEIIAGFEVLIGYLQKMGISREKVLVVAPPIPNDKDLNFALYEQYGRLAFLSKNMGLELKKDKIHPTIDADIVWSYAVFTVVNSMLNTTSLSFQ